MDTLTHALSGALLARALARENGPIPLKPQMTVGFLAAAFPDIDIVATLFGPLTYLEYHRSLTHSLILLPLWAMLLGYLFGKLYKNRYDTKALTLLSAWCILIHIFGDLITAYGTMALAPLSWDKLSWPATFIIDFWFSGIIIGGLLLAAIFRRQGGRIAVGALATLVLYIGYQGDLRWQAEQVAEREAVSRGLTDYQVFAQPQPLSPLNWKLVIADKSQYLIGYLRLHSDQPVKTLPADAGFLTRVAALYRPANELDWLSRSRFGQNGQVRLASEVWQLPALKAVRDFMQFPALIVTQAPSPDNCLWFRDERFVLDGVRDGDFIFGACKTKASDWTAYRLRKGELLPL